MRKKKHVFHCERCGDECTIYRKGKSHRVFVCDNCGVLATNGKKKKSKAGKVAKAILKDIPVVGTAVSVAEEILSKKEDVPKSSNVQRIIFDSKDKVNPNYWVEKALR